MEQTSCAFKSPFGWIEITTLKQAIVALEFVQNPKNLNIFFTSFQDEIIKQLENYFDKRNYHFNSKIAAKGTSFQKKIWPLLSKVPKGSTVSYLKIAQLYGNTKAVRAIAGAISKNPVLIIIPCHRVVGSDGSLVGYSGGLENKRALLDHEGYSN